MSSPSKDAALRARQRIDKYRIEERIASGGYATVYQAFDTIEGHRVALKVPHNTVLSEAVLVDLVKEVRINARLDHPNILPVKNASVVDHLFYVAYPLGIESLADRLCRRLTATKALSYAEQMLAAVAHAHERRIVHCDIKPENFILFEQDHVRLGDFGIAKLAWGTRTLEGGGSGTLGYVAPEQALGYPSSRSDVFSLGLIIYRMLTGCLPKWPFDWPFPGHDRLRRVLSQDGVSWLRRSVHVHDRKRYKDAVQMLAAYRRVRRRLPRRPAPSRRARRSSPTWTELRWRQLRRAHGRVLGMRARCEHCSGPLSETMGFCPWCGEEVAEYHGPTPLPRRCPTCGRGVKSDWRYCAWCKSGPLPDRSHRAWKDRRYVRRCDNPGCSRHVLLPFSRYCPWCRRKVRKPWSLAVGGRRCGHCGWGIAPEYWDYCPWCGEANHGAATTRSRRHSQRRRR